ncbi:heme exporter protein CcmD [Nioella sp.]|jgi:heme exporter protein D|uniref:heme exporter protein CcmD n=1 Tax=Nioella sp. TaxID=1912091 RepID=UPI003A853285
MPDLGRYATEVLSAYAGAIALLVILIAASVWKARKVLRQLREAENRRDSSA